jgi:hypothetical protein
MASSGMLRRVTLVRTDFSEELSTSFIRMTRIGETEFLRSVRRLLVTASVVPTSPILVTLMKEALSSSETTVITRATQRNILGDALLCSIAVSQGERTYQFARVHSDDQHVCSHS